MEPVPPPLFPPLTNKRAFASEAARYGYVDLEPHLQNQISEHVAYRDSDQAALGTGKREFDRNIGF